MQLLRFPKVVCLYFAFHLFIINKDTCSAAPINDISRDKRNFIERYVEFIDDKSVKKFFGEPRWDVNSFLIRNKRQVEQLDVNPDNPDPSMEEAQPGFFDRAAKFVVELLQRFLKWINSDN